MNVTSSLANSFRQLHEDEEGMEAIDVVMVVAIAAIVVLYLRGSVWPKVSQWVSRQVEQLTHG